LRFVERLRISRGVWPFGVVEAVWSVVAIRRYRNRDARAEALEAAGLRE
jgi:hypothetical protein